MFKHARLAMLALSAALALVANPAGAVADAPDVASGNGITVSGKRWISSRTLEVDISTTKVASNSVNGPHRVRITLPEDYFERPTTRYPVLYLLHGGAGGNSAQWTTGGGAAEAITAGKPLITVMPDGGKVGWYTNWVEQTQGAQAWADFHLNQLIPWVDANLRTIDTKQGRAIAGLSMGGFGAVRYAQDRPDLFAYVASFSGAVDLGQNSNPQTYGTRFVIGQQAMQNGYLFTGPFGNPFPPLDTGWTSVNPVNRAARLLAGGGVGVGLWVGSGIGPWDVLEGTMARANAAFDEALTAAGVPHYYRNYGRPGGSTGCDGGHNFGCWNYAFREALPRILAALETPGGGSGGGGTAANLVSDGDFESPGLGPWTCTGNCGADHGAGLARSGTGNGWVRNTSGWNEIHQTIAVQPDRDYILTAWIRTSSNNTDGRLGLKTAGGEVLGEQRFGRLDGYTKLTATVDSGSNTSLVVYAGLTASGDTWLQIDDVSVVALPETTIDSGPSGTVSQTDATFAFSSDATGATFECRIDAEAFAPCTSPQSYTGLPAGERTFEVRAISGGNADPTPAIRSWTIEATPPDTVIDSGPSGATSATDATFAFHATKPGTFECRLEPLEAGYTACDSPQSYGGLADGDYVFSVRAIGESGNADETPATSAWTVDTAAPNTAIDTGPTGTITTSEATFAFQATEPGTFECRLEPVQDTYGPCDSPQSYTGLSDGDYVLHVRAVDAAGNADPTSATRAFTVDTTAPVIVITGGPTEGETTKNRRATFTFTVDDADASRWCRLDEGPAIACDSSFETGRLDRGPHVFTVSATDSAGNGASVSRSWTIESPAPQH